VYFHVQVMNDARQHVSASKLQVDLTKLTNMITGQTYNEPAHQVLNVTSEWIAVANATTGDKGQRVINLSLSGLSLSSGYYEARIKVTDDEGCVDYGTSFFQVSNLDVMAETRRSGSSAFIFKPSDTVQLYATAYYFNGSKVENGATVSLDKLLLISGTTPKTISTDVYTSTTNTTKNGVATITVRPKSGQTLPSGDYLAFVKVTAGSVSEVREAWFMVKSFFLYAYTVPYYYASPAQATTIYGFVFDPDWNALNGVNISFDGFYDVKNFEKVKNINKPKTVTAGWGSFELAVNSTPSKEGTYVYVINAFNPLTGEAEEYMDFLQVQRFSNVECSFVNAGQSTVTPSTAVNYKITITDATGSGVANQNVTVSKFTNVDTWNDRTATTTSSGMTNADGVATLTVTAPSVIGKYRPIASVNGEEMSSDTYRYGMWPCEIGVYKTEVSIELANKDSLITTNFVPQSNISVRFLLTNPGGGAVSMNELKLVQYQCLTQSCKTGSTSPWTTTLGSTKTSNFAATNTLKFKAPLKEGTYLLVTQAKDTDNSISTIPVTFNVVAATFNYYLWLTSTAINQGTPINVTIDTEGTIKVNVSSLRNINTKTVVNLGGQETQFSAGKGQQYVYDTSSLTPGTYEVALCAYTSSCTNTSTRKQFVFTVIGSSFPEGRPFNPSGAYVANRNITFEVRLANRTGGSRQVESGNVMLVSLKKGKNGFAAYFSTNVTDSPSPGWKLVTLSGYSLAPGDYEAVIGLNYSGSVYHAKIFFYITEYEFKLATRDGPEMSMGNFMVPVYATDTDVTFNITGSPNRNGTLNIFDTNGWVLMPQYTKSFRLDGSGFNQTSISFSEGKNYVAVAAIPNLQDPNHREAHYPFDIKAGFDIRLNWEGMRPDIGQNQNLTLNFTVLSINGTPMESGAINVTILKYRNPKNWEVVNDSVGISGSNLPIGAGGATTFQFDPDTGLGEYVAEITFSMGANQVMQSTWFWVKSGDFFVWSDKDNYAPGETVLIFAQIRNTDWSGMSGENVTLTNVTFGSQNLPGAITTGAAITDSNGNAQMQFTLPRDKTGNFMVTVKWNETGETRTQTVRASTYKAEIFDQTWPPFSGGDTYTMEVRVYDKNNAPVSNIPVNYTVRSEKNNWQAVPGADNVNVSKTDASGKTIISYQIPGDANGFYDMEIVIGNGIMKKWRGFQVSPFEVYMSLYGEKTGEDAIYNDWEIPGDATIVISAEVRTQGGTPIQNATVTLQEVWQMGWGPGTQVNVTSNITS
ncbi:hypothetical protein COY95_03545, partial [Candidatus Woesearchaeota archaeon CG_4_10_14_0_8_um_filter_47_5]